MEKKALKPSHRKNDSSIGDLVQSHPFEYLNKLNSINNECNKMNVLHQSFSSVSKIKLPWKNFNIINIPSYFQQNYPSHREKENESYIMNECNMDDNQRKFWKEHRQIIQRHIEQKKEYKRPVTASAKNEQYVKQILEKDRNNIFLKKILEKGTKFNYDREELEREILKKLKNVDKRKNIKRVQSALESKKNQSEKKSSENALKETINSTKQKQNNHSIRKSSKDYLDFERGEEMLVRYKKKIQEVDCSISNSNVKKTLGLIKSMERRVRELS